MKGVWRVCLSQESAKDAVDDLVEGQEAAGHVWAGCVMSGLSPGLVRLFLSGTIPYT